MLDLWGGHKSRITEFRFDNEEISKSRAVLEETVDFGCGLEQPVDVEGNPCLPVTWVSECVREQSREDFGITLE